MLDSFTFSHNVFSLHQLEDLFQIRHYMKILYWCDGFIWHAVCNDVTNFKPYFLLNNNISELKFDLDYT